ncbi:hypothetical protein EJ04DRAFT_59900 [Polyplosphaeria fusca]|uniref:Uncharacterized protein n=1 Tax=Polyplosphaeria fusca TaxID=682080 RepID=A0A9P4R2I9_9PLEO|nr:hypothetical protein EJ04DRAFT_59900 [Polyplosphaeria fusca]
MLLQPSGERNGALQFAACEGGRSWDWTGLGWTEGAPRLVRSAELRVQVVCTCVYSAGIISSRVGFVLRWKCLGGEGTGWLHLSPHRLPRMHLRSSYLCWHIDDMLLDSFAIVWMPRCLLFSLSLSLSLQHTCTPYCTTDVRPRPVRAWNESEKCAPRDAARLLSAVIWWTTDVICLMWGLAAPSLRREWRAVAKLCRDW